MTSTPVSDRHDGDRRGPSVALDAAMPAPGGRDVEAAAHGGGAPAAIEDAGRPVPVADGVAPTRGEAVGMDWSGTRNAASVGQLLEASAVIDAARVRQLEALVRVLEDGAAEDVVGLPVEVVLAQSGRVARQERSRLLEAARVLARMPAVRHGFRTGTVSWSQVDAIAWTVADIPVGRWGELDAIVADTALSQADAEADSLVVDVEWAAARIAGELRAERTRTPVADNRVRFTPRLDGSGDLHACYDATHFPIMVDRVDAATRDLEPVPDPTADGADVDVADGDGGGVMGAGLTEAHRQAAKVAGRNATRRAAALFGLVVGWDADTLHPLDGDGRGDGDTRHGAGGGAAGRPSVLVTTDLDALLDGTTPVWLVNRLAGRMHVTADVARRWVHVHGADVRLVVMDDGQPVGVGDRRKVPPGWLRDAIIARDLHDTAPTSTTPALLCDIDHTVPWDDDPAAGGTTDVGNLALVSRRWHTRKTRGQLHLDRHADGSATWTVTATGYRVHTAPPPHLARRAPLRPAAWRRLDHIPPPDHPDPRWADLCWPDPRWLDPGGSNPPGLGRAAGTRGHGRAPP